VSPGTTITAVVARASSPPSTTHSYVVSGQLYFSERALFADDIGTRDARLLLGERDDDDDKDATRGDARARRETTRTTRAMAFG